MPYHVEVSYNVGEDYWVTLDEFVYRGATELIRVPAGFRFDLASIPRFFTRLIGKHELGLAAPLVHDYLYRNKGYVYSGNFTRADADWIFLKIMREDGVPGWRRWLAFFAVRLFGSKAFGT